MRTESTRPLLATRLDAQPPIFRGCTSSELLGILTGTVVVWLPLGFVLGAALGAVTMGLGIAVMGATGTVLGVTRGFARIKRGRPAGYHHQRLVAWLEDRGLQRRQHVRRSGPWDLGRRL